MSTTRTFACEICGSTFAFKSGLNLHHKTAKYCLEMQGKNAPTVECTFCHKEFASKTNLEGHFLVCDERKQKEYEDKLISQARQFETRLAEQARRLADYDSRIAEMKADYEERLREKDKAIESIHRTHHDSLIKLAAQRNVVNNTNNNTFHIAGPLDLSTENVKRVIDQHLTLQVLGNGQVGVADMLHDNLLTNKHGQLLYQCTDQNRGNFVHLDGSGQPVRDAKANRLRAALVDAQVGKKAIETLQEIPLNDERFPHYEQKAMEVVNISSQDAKFRAHLAARCAVVGNKEEEEDDD